MATTDNQSDATMREVAHEALTVGVVLERRPIDNPWKDHAWRAIGVADSLAGEGAAGTWRELGETPESARFLVSGFRIDLFSGETDGYTVNLSQPTPAVYVVLRPGEELEDHDVEPFAVTVCPYEAMSYAESGDEQVDNVPMPPDIRAWVEGFVARHHVEQPFKKRKRGDKAPRGQRGGRPRGRYGRDIT